MLKFLKKIFPLKVESIEALIDTLRREECKSVLVEANASEFAIRFSSMTPIGRKVVYRSYYCKSCLPNESGKRLAKAIALLYPIAESKVSKLKESLRGIRVDLITS